MVNPLDEAKEDAKKPTILLNKEDEAVLGIQKPLMPGYFRFDSMLVPNAYLKILNVLGIDSINQDIGDRFHINASVVKYLADIALFGKFKYQSDKKDIPTEPIEKRVLFSGGIQIFEKRDIGEQNINGYQLVRNAEIYTVSAVGDMRAGLNKILFGEARTTKGREERIEAILRGYNNQQRAQDCAQHNALHREYQRGDSDRAEETFGTFGRRY